MQAVEQASRFAAGTPLCHLRREKDVAVPPRQNACVLGAALSVLHICASNKQACRVWGASAQGKGASQFGTLRPAGRGTQLVNAWSPGPEKQTVGFAAKKYVTSWDDTNAMARAGAQRAARKKRRTNTGTLKRGSTLYGGHGNACASGAALPAFRVCPSVEEARRVWRASAQGKGVRRGESQAS